MCQEKYNTIEYWVYQRAPELSMLLEYWVFLSTVLIMCSVECQVEYYGTNVILKSIAQVSTPDGSTILVTPFDKSRWFCKHYLPIVLNNALCLDKLC